MRCAVDKCNQSNSKKPACGNLVSFYTFPKDATQRKLWLKFCNRANVINTQRAKICALHFKAEDFERNLKFEMGLSNRSTLKLKPGAIPTIETINVANEMEATTTENEKSPQHEIKMEMCELLLPEPLNTPMKTEINENYPQLEIKVENEEHSIQMINVEPYKIVTCNSLPAPMLTGNNENNQQLKFEVNTDNQGSPQQRVNLKLKTPMSTDIHADSLLLHIQMLESERDALRQENYMLRCSSAFKIKKLTRQIQSLSSKNTNLENALKRLFTDGQIKQLKNCGRRQNFTKEDIAQSITLYSTSPKAYILLKKKNFPLPSVRTLQRWSQRVNVSKGIFEPAAKA